MTTTTAMITALEQQRDVIHKRASEARHHAYFYHYGSMRECDRQRMVRDEVTVDVLGAVIRALRSAQEQESPQ